MFLLRVIQTQSIVCCGKWHQEEGGILFFIREKFSLFAGFSTHMEMSAGADTIDIGERESRL